MSWITAIFSAAASAYLTAALVYAFIWWRQRNAWAQLLFSLAALAAVGLVGCDLAEMHAESPAQFAAALRWTQLLLWVVVLALAGFVLLYFRAGRIWLFWTVCALRTLSLLLNYLTGQNLNYREITSLQSISFLGESVAIAKGAPNHIADVLPFLNGRRCHSRDRCPRAHNRGKITNHESFRMAWE